MTIKEKDFVQIQYTGRFKEGNEVFDTTDESLAKQHNLYAPNHSYGPVTICVGQHYLIEGIDKQLIGKEPGKSYTLEIEAEQAFGRKNGKLIKLVPTKVFLNQGIRPEAGMQVQLEGTLATIRTVNAGRSLVDFNHPLSGRDVVYDIKVLGILATDKDKVNGMADFFFKGKSQLNESHIATIYAEQEVPDEMAKNFRKKVLELIPSIKDVKFVVQKLSPGVKIEPVEKQEHHHHEHGKDHAHTAPEHHEKKSKHVPEDETVKNMDTKHQSGYRAP